MSVKSLFISILVISCCFSCKNKAAQKNIKVAEIKFTHEANLQISDSTNTPIKTLQIELAEDDYEHQTGLMYRKQMDTNKGMLFIFKDNEVRVHSFYMKNTYIPLDIIVIAPNKTIINIAENAEPLNEKSLFSDAPAKYVLEINAGLSQKWKLKPGYKINFTPLK